MRVLVVDDSVVFRSQIKNALSGTEGIEVVGTANNGRICLQKLEQMTVDLIVLDMEMPEMDGLTTIKGVKAKGLPVKILVFSSVTPRGSEMALEALSLGAHDIVTKPSGDDVNYQNASEKIASELVPKILQFTKKSQSLKDAQKNNHYIKDKSDKSLEYQVVDITTLKPQVIVIGSSTGGPPALEHILRDMPNPLSIPIFIAQHMPPMFTKSLAERIQQVSGVEAAEAKNNEVIKKNKIYIAPGDYHLRLKKTELGIVTSLDKGPLRNSVRPAVDHLFESASEIYKQKICAIILTGMGEDGKVGSIRIKNERGGVIIQNKESCVVFGMPGAVYNAKAFDEMLPLENIREAIISMVR